ncbi:DASS family sodium-coupled anion symporter [Lyticum sinuosum]|uniref:Anion permease superfamily protein n=1 Tax=Lyticum sinuosum TaxID=1332059 RepID=A0AAE4VKY1_9RICK|nr:DASS family sodium-coupled anion symporter [Lyticum sinuosum]MDZ5761219.1 Anion permease superfamily protein [Lyticum sinuosum]
MKKLLNNIINPFKSSKYFPIFIIFIFISFIYIIWENNPSGIQNESWHITIIFFATIILIITNILPLGVCAIFGITVATLTKSLTIHTALSGFSSTVTWLVICAFFLSDGIIKTGLGKRLAYIMLCKFGKTILGTSYSIIFTELLLAPLVPSASARSGGIMLPIIQNINEQYQQNFGEDKKLNKFFMMLLYHTNIITSAMFLTAMAANPLALSIAKNYGVNITWFDWFYKFAIPGFISLIILPHILLFLIKPTINSKQDLREITNKELKKLNLIGSSEIIMIILFICLIISWMTEKFTGINSTLSAMVIILIMLLLNIINWQDIIKNSSAWDCLFWYGILVMMADVVGKSGSFEFIASLLNNKIQHLDKLIGIIIIGIFYIYSHYFFASTTAHIMTLMGISLNIAVNMNFNPTISTLVFSSLSVLSGGYTHYGLSSGPAIFAKQHLTVREWWKISLYVTNLNIFIWIIAITI